MVVAGLLLAVIALAMVGGVLGSTSELIRLLRRPGSHAVIVPALVDDGGAWDASPANDVTFETAVEPLREEDAESTSLLTADAATRRRQPIANSIEISAGPAAEETAGATPSPAPVVAASVPEASAPQAHRDASVEPREKPAKEAAAPIRCGQRTCPEGQTCCNWACSICTSPGETCSLSCGSPTLPVSAACGPNTCNVGEVCCNASCGICVPSGGTCSKEPCTGMYLPVSPTCGMNTCNSGEVCCNPSCGICVKPGEQCNLEPCR